MKPTTYRRLTKTEAARLGVSYSAKRQVRADIKRVTKATKLYSNRHAHTETIARSTGTRQSKESYRKSRFVVTRDKDGRQTITYKNMSKRELIAALKRHRGLGVVLKFHAEFGGGGRSGAAGGVGWRYGFSEIDANELLDEGSLEDYEARSRVLSTPDRYGAVFR